jgi:hypothetical protein
MSRALILELLLSLGHAVVGYASAFVPLVLRRLLAACLNWDPTPTSIWLIGSALLGLLAVTLVSFGMKPSANTHNAGVRFLGRLLFGVSVFPFALLSLVSMAPDARGMLAYYWPFLCCLVISSVVGLLILWFSVKGSQRFF